ncbi:MAG: fused MFS/spermidine synthase [Armatimonadota bacterium]
MIRHILLALALASGASALVYQVVWMRRLVLVFGSTTLATSTVLVAFLGGLAIGAWLWGQVADRHPGRGLWIFGLVEAATGAYGLASVWILSVVERAYVIEYPAVENLPRVYVGLQFVLGAIAVLPAAVLMGGTVPLLARGASAAGQIAGGVGRLYGWNTIGAAVGAGLATYGLLPVVGLRGAVMLAAVGNLAVAGAALLIDARRRRAEQMSSQIAAPVDGPGSSRDQDVLDAHDRVRWLVILQGMGLSGLAVIGYEVAWARLMALVVGSSVYAFGTLVVVLLAGLGIGSWWYGRLRLSTEGHVVAFGVLELLIGLTAAASLLIAPHLPFIYMRLFPVFKDAFGWTLGVQIGLTAAIALVPALLSGATFPAVVGSLGGTERRVGRTIGCAYAANTVGTVLGAFLAGFVLIPAVGLRATIVLGVLANLAAGVASLLALPRTGRPLGGRLVLGAPGLAALLIVVTLPPWPREVFAAGAGYFAPAYGSLAGLTRAISEMRLLYHRDGVNTTISVDEIGEHRVYRSNGKTDASTFPSDMATQLLLGHVPMLLHPDPREVFILGLGTGVTAAAVARYPVRKIDLIEFEPAAVEAARLFERQNRGVIDDPRVRLLLADGRNRLLAATDRYDVVISDASDLWVAGVGSLFTVEFYQAARARLRPGGVMVQWVHTHSLPPPALTLLVSTFRATFPHAAIWSSGFANVILIGSADPVVWDYTRLARRITAIPGVREDLKSLGVWHPLALFAAYVADGDALARMVAASPVHTDDFPVLEFSTPRWLYVDTAKSIEEVLEKMRGSPFPTMTGIELSRALDADATYLFGFAHASLWRPRMGIPFMERSVVMAPGRLAFAIGLGHQYRSVGRGAEAEAAYLRAIALDPRQVEARVALGELLLERGQAARALALAEAALAIAPSDARAKALAGRARAGISK